jgi:AraC-like DNA-binding protein
MVERDEVLRFEDIMARMPFWDYPRASAGVRTLVEAGVDRGLSVERCLASTRLRPADLSDPDLLVEAGQELQVMRNLLGALGDVPGLGVDAGCRITVGSFGIWGYAMLTSPTWGDALAIAFRFARLSYAFVNPRPRRGVTPTFVDFDLSEIPPDMRDFITERDLAASIALLEGIGGRRVPLRVQTHLTGARLRALQSVTTTMRVIGNCAGDAVIADAGAEAEPLPQADAMTLRVAERACQEIIERRAARRGVAARVRSRLLEHPDLKPAMAAVAADLHIEVRTLRRHLAAEDTTFQQLRDEVHQTLAIELLTTAALSVEDVATRLGYSDAAGFSHAFKRWTGSTPGAYRTASRNA